MLVISTLRLFGPAFSHDRWQKNAYLESMLVHARNLIEFLAERPSKNANDDRDIDAHDFVDSWEVDPDLAERLRSYLPIIDKQISHLSWSRVDGEKKEWRVDLTGDLLTAFESFAHALKKSPALPHSPLLRVDAFNRELGLYRGSPSGGGPAAASSR